mmetsp:Transcript_93800/g.265294  ORF Transcript_93800/g.265294 Transcript_93800/m.265294 type:complete len:195 (-) Transcript_93800:23-607(-)
MHEQDVTFSPSRTASGRSEARTPELLLGFQSLVGKHVPGRAGAIIESTRAQETNAAIARVRANRLRQEAEVAERMAQRQASVIPMAPQSPRAPQRPVPSRERRYHRTKEQFTFPRAIRTDAEYMLTSPTFRDQNALTWPTGDPNTPRRRALGRAGEHSVVKAAARTTRTADSADSVLSGGYRSQEWPGPQGWYN